MQWTQEQQPIIHSTADKLLVQAFAYRQNHHTGGLRHTTRLGENALPLLQQIRRARCQGPLSTQKRGV